MYLKNLKLRNYRNYEQQELFFENKINVILGENAQGKTNILEAIYVLAMAKSHRTTNDKDMIRWEQEYARIEGLVLKKNGSMSLELIISKKGKRARSNHLEQTRLSHYVGNMNIVMFAPEDLAIVKGSPQVRRRFIDMEIGQVSPTYLHDLSQYQKVLHQRNHCLKKLQMRLGNETVLDVLTEQLVHLGAKVTLKRLKFIQILQELAKPIHERISRGTEELVVHYITNINISESMELLKIVDVYTEKLKAIKQKEIDRGVTLAGPHRDDLSFIVNGKDVQTFGSQGQQRTTALSIKLAEIEMIYSEVGSYPILLLDDVLSELDDFRQTQLLNAIRGKVQTFVTTTNIEGIEHEVIKEATIHYVTCGKVVKESVGGKID